MKLFHSCLRLICRLRHPVSLPEDVARVLGIHISNFASFERLVDSISLVGCYPVTLKKFMPRKHAEAVFKNALKKDRFGENSRFSYYFNQGWIEFNLQFDEQQRLRRLYLQHKRISSDEGVEIPLAAPCQESSCSG